jgi:hypothetical protein
MRTENSGTKMNDARDDLLDEDNDAGMYLNVLADPDEGEAAMFLNSLVDDPEELVEETFPNQTEMKNSADR